MAKFHSPIFPNLSLMGGGIVLQFVDHFLETEKEEEIKMLEASGFLQVDKKKPVEKKAPVKVEEK